jgi:8-oxo-dGTP pyrophosphatase MutT (NUDIX family)
MINKIKLLERHTIDTQNAVFVSFITEEETVPSIGMIMRTDGSFGFVGGRVDEGETLEQALVREVLEEVGYQISLSKIVPLTSHTIKGGSSTLHTHHYTCHVPTHELLRLQNNQAKGELHNREVAGFCIVPTIPASVDNLLKLPFAGTAKEELIYLLKYINIF